MNVEEGNRKIAEWFRGHTPDLAWEPAQRCPQGHHMMIAVESEANDDNDAWVPDVAWGIGSLCLRCIAQPIFEDHPMWDRLYYGYVMAMRIREDHQTDRTWHPEWRIQAVPHDFRKPAYLLEALAATRWDVEWWYYEKSPEGAVESGYNVEITDRDDDSTVIGVASAQDLVQALWEALVEAVDGGLGSEDA